MLKKTMTYTDFDGNERTEDFHFNLSKSEIVEMELAQAGGLSAMLKRIVAERDKSRIITMFKDIIYRSYGEKSDDGKRFVKVRNGERLAEAFMQTQAFDDLFMELANDAEKASAFVNALIPKDLADKAAGDAANRNP